MTQLLFHTNFPPPALLSHYGGRLIFTLQTWRFSLLQGLTVLEHGRVCMEKRLPCRTEMQTHDFCQKKSHWFQWTLSGSPGSLLDSLSSCSIAKHHGRANAGKQGSRERNCPRKVTRSKSSVFTIFLCLTSCTISLNDHCRKR